MDISPILKPEFKEFYDFSKKIFVPNDQFKYKNCISLNFFNNNLYSIKLYFATFKKYNRDEIGDYFDYNDLEKLYEIWDTSNLDNKGLSFCLKYYPKENCFKKQIHCKIKVNLTFRNFNFTNENCRYGVGIESGEIKLYTNLKNKADKINVAKYFNKPQLSFFDELEYCESYGNSKVIASFSGDDRDLMCNLIKNESTQEVYSYLDTLFKDYKIRPRNIGFYDIQEVKSYYLYSDKSDFGIDTYGTLLKNYDR